MDINSMMTILTSLSVGGVISSLITLRYTKSKARSEADLAELNNAKQILDMYKQSFEHMRELHDSREKELMEKYDQLSKDFDDYKKTAKQRMEELEDKIKTLNQLNQELKNMVVKG